MKVDPGFARLSDQPANGCSGLLVGRESPSKPQKVAEGFLSPAVTCKGSPAAS